jgi:hypothetical protein
MYNGHNNQQLAATEITGNVTITQDILSELHAQLSLYIDQALGYHEGELGVRAREAWQYYYGELPTAVCSGASSWVDRTVWESVNGVVQELSNVFTSAEEAVKFSPINSQDGAEALAATRMVNQILLQENEGYNVLNDAFKEACVVRNSFIKRYWETRVDAVVQDVSGVTEEQISIFIALLKETSEGFIDSDIEYDEDTGLGEGSLSYRIKTEGVKVEYTPFEQVLIEPSATDLSDASYVGHRVRKTKDELINMGFDAETIKELSPASTDIEAGVIANERINNISPMNVSDVVMTGDEKADKLWLYENYIKSSIVSGELELFQVFTIHGQILELNRVSEIPFDTITPFPIPGFVFGESVTDITKDIQDLNSFTVRGVIDNIMNANFRRYTAIKGAYDRKSLLDNRPGGVVEIQTAGAITPFPYHALPSGMPQLLEYIEQKKEQRTGVTRLGQGLNADIYKNDNSEGMVNTMLSAAQNRLRMICRNIANSGMQDLMKGIYNLVRENGVKPITIMTPQGETQVDPRTLPDRISMVVSLAIGANERQERGTTLMNLFKGTLQNPATAGMMNPTQIYHATAEIYKSMGIYDVENFLTHPSQIPPKEPTPEEQMATQGMQEQLKLQQAQTLKIHNDIKIDDQKLEFEQVKAADDFTMRKEESLSEQDENADKMVLEENKLQLDTSIAAFDAMHKKKLYELEQQKLALEAQIESSQGRPVSLND